MQRSAILFFVHFTRPAIASLVTQRKGGALRDETETAARGSATIPVYTVADLIYYGNFQ